MAVILWGAAPSPRAERVGWDAVDEGNSIGRDLKKYCSVIVPFAMWAGKAHGTRNADPMAFIVQRALYICHTFWGVKAWLCG